MNNQKEMYSKISPQDFTPTHHSVKYMLL